MGELIVKRTFLEGTVPRPVRYRHEGKGNLTPMADQGIVAGGELPPLLPVHRYHLRLRRLMQEFPRPSNILLPCPRRVEAVVPDSPEVLVMDVDDQAGDEHLHAHPQGFAFLSFSLVLILEGHVFSVIVLNPALGKDGSLGVPADVLGGKTSVGEPHPHPHVPGLEIEHVPELGERLLPSPGTGIPHSPSTRGSCP